jgi:hypothetical protein
MHRPDHRLSPFAARLLTTLGLGALAGAGLAACGGRVIVDPSTGGAGGAGGSGGSGGSGNAGGSGGSGNAGNAGGSGGAVPVCPPVAGPGQVVWSACVPLVDSDYCPPAGDYLLDDVAPYLPTECDESGCYCTTPLSVDCDGFPTTDSCCYQGIGESYNCGVPGRPLRVERAVCTATPVTRVDWRAEPSQARPSLAGAQTEALPEPIPEALLLEALPLDARLALGAAYTVEALHEHASIASFARHALELLALGAPAELVGLATLAMHDEIEHARLMFGLATRYSGAAVGPGRLVMATAPAELPSLASVARATVEEGCVNELLAAIVVRAAAGAASDPVVAATLSRVADDEERHAELAFRVVAWALSVGGPEVREAVDQAFASARVTEGERPDDTLPAHVTAALRAHGRLHAREATALMEQGLRDVVLPVGRALVASVGEGRPYASAALREALGAS